MRALNPAGFDELLDTGIPHTHKARIQPRQKRRWPPPGANDKHPEQHESYHGWLILTLQRGNALIPLKLDKITSGAIPKGTSRFFATPAS
jgi:hypothetical protein